MRLKAYFKYNSKTSLDDNPHFTIELKSGSDSDNYSHHHYKNDDKMLASLVVCLNKMYANKTYYLYEHGHLYMSVSDIIYFF